MIIYLDQANKPDSVLEQWVYPDGVSTQVRLTPDGVKQVAQAFQVEIVANLKSAQDTVNLLHLLNAIRGVSAVPVELILPYLPYSRADRRFSPGDTYGLQTFLTMLAPYNVRIKSFDVHSMKGLEGVVENVDPWEFVAQTILDVMVSSGNIHRVNILLPDEGAINRYPQLAGASPMLKDSEHVRVLTASKKRDPRTGTLSGFEVPSKDAFFADTPVLIADDLCDGGGTFVGIAQKLREIGITAPLSLYVSHGIFSRGLEILYKHFDHIYTTNTVDHLEYKAWPESRLKVYNAQAQLLHLQLATH